MLDISLTRDDCERVLSFLVDLKSLIQCMRHFFGLVFLFYFVFVLDFGMVVVVGFFGYYFRFTQGSVTACGIFHIYATLHLQEVHLAEASPVA